MSQTTSRERSNWLIHSLFVRNEHDAALRLIEEQLRASGGLCEYALYIKGLIRRQQGVLPESLQLFQAALCLNPKSATNLKQVARSLSLTGQHRAALDVYSAAAAADANDWEIFHARGLCLEALGEHSAAADAFAAANEVAGHRPRVGTSVALARALVAGGDLEGALNVYAEALEYAPTSTEVLTAMGLLHYKMGDTARAFECLGNSLTHDPSDARAALAAAAIIEEAADYDVALVKYRVAAARTPNSAALWSNVGMCFFGKGKAIAAIACLQRAQFLDPFSWSTAFNLGIVHLSAEQPASAFHYLNTATSLQPDDAQTLMYLGVALARLEDPGNARAAYEKALSVAGSKPPPNLYLNYAATLLRIGDVDAARQKLAAHDAAPQVRFLAPGMRRASFEASN
jgi:Bardet-Biedl syndrome 4 protein